MVKFNHAITRSLFPGIDVEKTVAPKQFMNVFEFHEYILKDVDEGFRGASDYYANKSYFHQ